MFINEEYLKEERDHLAFIKQGSQWISVEVGLMSEHKTVLCSSPCFHPIFSNINSELKLWILILVF